MKEKKLEDTQRLIIIGTGGNCDKSKCCNSEIIHKRPYPFTLICRECRREIIYESQVLWKKKKPSYEQA